MADFSGIERRKLVRIPEPLKCEYRLLEKEPDNPFSNWSSCVSSDISIGGVCLRVHNLTGKQVDELVNKSHIFELKIFLPDQKEVITRGNLSTFKIIGKAVWNNVTGEILELGIKFIELEKESEVLIRSYIIQQYLNSYGKK